MRIAVPKEIHPGENRVAATPDSVADLIKLGFTVAIEHEAGINAGFSNESYSAAGAQIVTDTAALWADGDIVLKVRPPEQNQNLNKSEVDLLATGATLIGFLDPAGDQDRLEALAKRECNVVAMEAIPRTTLAQSMDALSSMANLAGYRAVVEAANCYQGFFTGQVTAAGRLAPAKVLVIGAGVAGLAAIGAARALGAIVRAFDTRPATKEQVESMGAEFLMLEFAEDGTGEGGYAKVMSDEFIAAEMDLFRAQAKEVDIIITTALIPGRPAPVLLPADVVANLKTGSVVVDLAAEQGGNCVHTVPGQSITKDGVHYVGYTDLPSRMANTASRLYARNFIHLLKHGGGAEGWHIDPEDAILGPATIVREQTVHWPPPRPAPSPEAKPEPKPAPAVSPSTSKSKEKKGSSTWLLAVTGLALIGLGAVGPDDFLAHLTVFVLACFVGWQIVWNVTPALHTPLMAVTNAISGIIVVGGLLHLTADISGATILGAVAVFLASLNISGGFLVTQRMLSMFRRDAS